MVKKRVLTKQEQDVRSAIRETQLYIQYKAAGWFLRLIRADMVKMDSSFFECLYLLTNSDLRSLIGKVMIGIQARRIDQSKDGLREDQKALKVLRHIMSNWSNHELLRDIEYVINENPCIVDILQECLIEFCEKITGKSVTVPANYASARKNLEKFFALSPAAIDLCEFMYLMQTDSKLREYFDISLKIWDRDKKDILAYILDMNSSTLELEASELNVCGITEHMCWEFYSNKLLSSMVISLWEATGADNIDRFFYSPLEGNILPLEKFRVSEEDLRYVKGLLTSKSDTPVHILLYGPPGTGKTTFARSLAHDLKIRAWNINSGENDDDRKRRAALIAGLNIACKKTNGFVLVDEAERLLDTSWHGGSFEKDKAWLNSLLEKPKNHVIWIVNHASHIDSAVLRRFSFSVKFNTLNKQERHDMWEDIIDRHNAKKYFTEPQIETLAERPNISAAVMEKAVTQAKELGYKSKEFFPAVECYLNAYSALVSPIEITSRTKRTKNTIKTEAAQNFTLDGITVEESISDLIARFRRADEVMRNDKRKLTGGCASLLFYGPPGTGKTALARYIAQELGRNCIIQRASDLLSCYVGDTEKKIASAFSRVEEENSLLIIDEVDSFLFSRKMAQRSWEVSMVNEFLTRLEECRSFCICTTNRFEDLNDAALRRFSYKVAFKYAQPSQLMALYNALLSPLCEAPLPADLEKELKSFSHLTPGDFRTVCTQYGSLFSDEPYVQHDTLISALRKEESLKSGFLSRTAGF